MKTWFVMNDCFHVWALEWVMKSRPWHEARAMYFHEIHILKANSTRLH
jgi:hypothetical protein